MTILNVGVGQTYTTISSAVRAAMDGDTVLVQAGTYVNDFTTVAHNITMKSVGGLAVMAATTAPPNGKAILTADASLTIEGFGFTGAAVGDGNGAGIRYEAGDLVVRNSVFWDNQDGILANGVPTGTILIDGSEFSHNGAGDGLTHNIYVGGIAQLTIQNSYFHDSVVGHEIKSRAQNTVIKNNRIFDNSSDASYSIDLPQGGIATVTGNIIEKGVNAQNWISLHFGGEVSPYPNSSLQISGNTIVNDNANGYLLVNALTDASVSLTGNSIWGFDPTHVTLGPVTVGTNTVLATRPTLDLSTIAPAVTNTGGTTVPEVPDPAILPAYLDFGRAGAVTASGRILTVGAHGQYTTLATALFASKDGDTIQVAAGTYTDDFGVATHKVIIEGVGGMATFTQSRTLSDLPHAILTVSNDVTLRNIEVTGASITGHQPGLDVTAGHVTLVNTYIHDNDIGLWADDNPDTTVSVYDSELGFNGNVAKGTNNVQIGRIGSFTMVNDYVHGAISGHEIFDFAYNSVIQGNRIIDGAGVPSSFLLDLGRGGNALVQGNTFDKGPDAVNGVLIHVGGEGAQYSNSNVRITGNVLDSSLANAGHPYTYFVVRDGGQNSVPMTVSGNTFVGGVRGSAQVTNGTSLNATVAATAVLDTSAPWSAAAAAAPAPVQSGPNVLTLSLTEVPAQTDAQYIVSVDGVDIGGGWVKAKDGIDAPQQASFKGWWGEGTHTVTLRSTNIIWKVTPGASVIDLKSITLDGNTVGGGIVTYGNTTFTTTISGSTKLPDFDAAYYLAHNPDVAAARMDPLQHYLTYGWREGRNPDAYFDTRYYLSHNPDVAAAGINPLQHFETCGWKEGRDPSAQFSVARYLAAYPTVAAANVDPLQDFLRSVASGSTARMAFAVPSAFTASGDPLIDNALYAAAHPDIAAFGIDAATYYHNIGWHLNENPNAWFDTRFYLASNPDVAAAGIDPLQHFEVFGWKEGRDPSPYFSLSAYKSAHPEAPANVDPLLTFIQSGEAATQTLQYATREAQSFDPSYYLAHNPDVAAAHVDPLVQYETVGWHEGRDPSAAFSTTKYLAAYSDVRAANVDPLAHYVNFGRSEGRSAFAV